MFWPDDTTLSKQDWWNAAAWTDGPTFGELVTALRPALRTAALHGYAVDGINLGFGPGVALPGEWQFIDLDTLELTPGESVSPDLPGDANIWLDVVGISDLIGSLARTYATGLTIPLFTSDYTDDHSVPKDIETAVESFAEAAIAKLARRVADAGSMPRRDAEGLLWLFDARQWFPTSRNLEFWIQGTLNQLNLDPVGFLRGQVFADRSRHRPDLERGPANLYFLMSGGAANVTVLHMHNAVWTALMGDLQGRGGATRIAQAARRLYRSADRAPTWLDVLLDLIGRGVIAIDGLVDPGEPPEGITTEVLAATGDRVDELRLWVWGETPITLRRETEFPDQAQPGVAASVAWDYVPGDGQVKPTVLLVAGRGVAIDHKISTAAYRPWDLQVFRVQDDALIPSHGSLIDTSLLLAGTQLEPDESEFVGPIVDEYLADYPQLFVKPKADGMLLVYPTSPGVLPSEISAATTDFVPGVVELTVDPKSGRHAYAIDVHYFTDEFWDIEFEWPFRGGAHVTVWASEGVTITSNLSGNTGAASAGNPSVLTSTIDGHLLVVELWITDRRNLLPRPWRADLPVTPWDVAATPATWVLVLEEMWTGLVPQAIQDLWDAWVSQPIEQKFTGDRTHPFPDPVPAELAYDADANRAQWRDAASGETITLTPAPHAYKLYGYIDSLLMDAADVALGFVPYVGDIADVGEAAYAYQTGRDKWGRPVSRLQLAIMMVCAAIPVVSSRFILRVGDVLAGLVRSAPPEELAKPATLAEMARLTRGTDWYDNLSMEQVHAAMAEPSPLRAAGAQSSPAQRELSSELTTTLAADGPIRGLADSLLAGEYRGWLTMADLLTDDESYGFVTNALQIPYLRGLRRDPALTPTAFVEALDAG